MDEAAGEKAPPERASGSDAEVLIIEPVGDFLGLSQDCDGRALPDK